MFRKRNDFIPPPTQAAPTERVTTVLGAGVSLKGSLSGSGGVRIEGAFDGEIALRGLLVIGESGRVTCERLRAVTVIVLGAVRGDILAEKLEIRKTGRVWGNVVVASFATEEGAFLRGQIRMEEKVDLELAEKVEVEPSPPVPEPALAPEPEPRPTAEPRPAENL
jgi:cytoskeletal protein CcmA (bactofilin family)